MPQLLGSRGEGKRRKLFPKLKMADFRKNGLFEAKIAYFRPKIADFSIKWPILGKNRRILNKNGRK